MDSPFSPYPSTPTPTSATLKTLSGTPQSTESGGLEKAHVSLNSSGANNKNVSFAKPITPHRVNQNLPPAPSPFASTTADPQLPLGNMFTPIKSSPGSKSSSFSPSSSSRSNSKNYFTPHRPLETKSPTAQKHILTSSPSFISSSIQRFDEYTTISNKSVNTLEGSWEHPATTLIEKTRRDGSFNGNDMSRIIWNSFACVLLFGFWAGGYGQLGFYLDLFTLLSMQQF